MPSTSQAKHFLRSNWMKVPPGLRPWLRRIALGLLIVYVAYLVLGNLFINTPMGPWVANRKPEKFQIQWSAGVTLWPGRVSVWDVRIKSRAGKIAWTANADKARGSLAILPLFKKQVRVTEVWVDEVTGSVDKLASGPPRPAPRPGGWVLQFDRIASDSIRHARYGKLVLDGTGSAEVGFYKQLRGGALELMPSRASFKDAHLRLDGDELLSEGTIDARFAIARVTREQAPGVRKLLFTDASLKLDGKSASLDITIDPRGKITTKVVPGKGNAHADIAFARGTLVPGSTLRWHMPVTGTNSLGTHHASALDIALDVDNDIALEAKTPAQDGGIVALDADLRVTGNQIPLQDLPSLLPRTSGHVTGRWQFASLRWVGALFAKGSMLSLDGAGSVDIDAQVVAGQLAAGSRVSVPDVAASIIVMGNRIEGNARADGRLDAGPAGELSPTLDLEMQSFVVAAADGRAKPYVEGQDLRLNVVTVGGVKPASLGSGDVLAQARDTFKAHLVFADARVPDLRAYNQFLPSTHLRFDGGSGLVGGDMTLDADGNIGQGWLRVNARGAKLHMADVALGGDVDIHTNLRQASLKTHGFNIDGSTIELRNISYSEPAGETRSGWWAKINLEQAQMDWDRPILVDGRLHIQMKDVGFLLSLFSRKSDYPKWILKLVDAGQADVRGKVQWHRDTLVLDRVEASNDRFQLAARMRLNKQGRAGSLYARWGILDVAVDARNGERDFKLIHSKKWYDAQPDLLR